MSVAEFVRIACEPALVLWVHGFGMGVGFGIAFGAVVIRIAFARTDSQS